MNPRFGSCSACFLAEFVFAAAARTVGDPLALLPTSLAAAGGAWFVFLVALGKRTSSTWIATSRLAPPEAPRSCYPSPSPTRSTASAS